MLGYDGSGGGKTARPITKLALARAMHPRCVLSAGLRSPLAKRPASAYPGAAQEIPDAPQRRPRGWYLPSMGSVGDCYDNAVAERFCATRKVGLLHRRPWSTRATAQLAIFAFIEVWHNRRRRHATLG